MNRDTLRQIAVIVAVAATIVMNILANALPLNNQTTGEISDRFPVYFVPAGYVFSIWGLIYIGLISYAVYQALPSQKHNPRLRNIGWLFVLSCAANIAWLFFWHYNLFPLTLAAMFILLALLIAIYLRLEVNRQPVSRGEKLAVHLPFSIYLGWITVASIANTSNVLYDLGWNGGPIAPEIWTVIMLTAAVFITAAMLYFRRDIAYALVIIWAAVGIFVAQTGVPLVPTVALVTAGVVSLLVVLSALRILPHSQRAVSI
jgi:translocator protein